MPQTQPRRPNILFIMCDDHAAQAIGCYGSRLNQTPNIDRIAAGGVRLDNCFVTNSICTPSRAAILTGQYNHVNGVTTLNTPFDSRRPHLAKHLQQAGYRTAMIGKWHLGEGPDHEPTGFDHWSVLPGQGDYFDPEFIGPEGCAREPGYVTDLITEKSVNWLKQPDDRPFFLMCHHKAPHRNFAPHPKYRDLYTDVELPVPDTFDDDYATRSRAAHEARMRVREDFEYEDLGLAQPEGGAEVGAIHFEGKPGRKVPHPEDPRGLRLVDVNTGEVFTFETQDELARFKYRRYLQRYLQCVASVDEGVGRLLDFLEDSGQAENTIVIYTSDQGFFLGEHGWFDKRFMYEESLRMPFLIRYPEGLAKGVSDSMICNVDFAPTLLDFAGAPVPSYMQGRSFRPCIEGARPADWPQEVYHRYWMHRDNSHQAFAHYGLRSARHKIIHWYNDGLGHAGTGAQTDPPEWELFDLESDPCELVNLWCVPEYAAVQAQMLEALNARMLAIGDIPQH
ncbi:sulfatase [Pseudoruegeria sp. SHC-113]|uniref:sulfatase family protein n=1 Tax=Pseudoruegeria sp. SHC-113 TaxID=2855439 RepID=UPI0021BB9485|nr:sulfatase [Pseudoruegeria sp. SHC-113]MCT8160680.1 sulfatase [Pseudoruegeria sp. SHC-113]